MDRKYMKSNDTPDPPPTNQNKTHTRTGKMMLQQARALVRKWRLKLQALPNLNRQVKEAMGRTVRCVITNG